MPSVTAAFVDVSLVLLAAEPSGGVDVRAALEGQVEIRVLCDVRVHDLGRAAGDPGDTAIVDKSNSQSFDS